ncbi:MAG: DMT family transporter [Acidimicrobiia bacterium]|nr:DMT family transporter [Acidimicrobiia bacterium]
MNASLLALGAAFAYGLADFTGGFATKRRSAWAVAGWSQVVGVGALAVGVVVVPATEVRPLDLVAGGIAGVFGVIGLGLLYRSLADGQMALLTPVVAASGGALTVVAGVFAGDRLDVVDLAAIAATFVAVLLVASPGGGAVPDRRPLFLAIAAGVCFGLFYVAMAQTGEASGLWPLVPARVVSILIALVLAGPDRWPPVRDRFGWVVATGLLDMVANLFIVLAAQRGPLAIVGVLSSLHPVVTITVAILWLRERPRPVQVVGMAMAIGAALLLA